MTSQDSERWDRRYRESGEFSVQAEPRSFLIECEGYLPQFGLVLDAACGLGNNAAFLLERGYQVIGIDLSAVGLKHAIQRLPRLMAVRGDLSYMDFPDSVFDLIINFYFLERRLYQAYKRWLKPGGLLIFETLTHEMLAIKPELNPHFLLKQGELQQAFFDWDILTYQEYSRLSTRGKTRAAASLAARKPGE
jgi:SAM-dependent methyltransferase